MMRTNKFEQIVRGMNSVSFPKYVTYEKDAVLCLKKLNCEWLISSQVLDVPLTVKIRTGVQEKTNTAHKLIPELKKWGVSLITVLELLFHLLWSFFIFRNI